ncbi:MAG: prepilin peptidase [bacterium]|nr:prepilin peptidase [bacterium]
MIPLLIFILGACFGSFLNVCIYRIPKKLSIFTPRSFCVNCKTPIKPWENIPFISYILLRGKCSTCKAKISPRYFIVELLTAIIYLLVFRRFGFGLPLMTYLFFSSLLIIITFIDLEHQLILNKITHSGIILGLLASFLLPNLSLFQSLLGGLMGGLVIYFLHLLSLLLFRKVGMGGGDLKLAILLGVFLGWKNLLLSLLIASFTGGIVGSILIFLRIKKRTDYIPYGPYLCLGAMVVLLWGEDIISWYKGWLFG